MISKLLLGRVANEVRVCEKCDLWKSRRNAVPGEGAYDSKVMLIGEGPGRSEDRLGRPFVGSAGGGLDRILRAAGLSREEVFITNVVKCRPPGNRRPRRREADTCYQYLGRQIEALNPSLIVLLGDTALKQFFPSARLSSVHGKLRRREGRRFIPTYHPAAMIYNRSLERIISKDFRGIRKLLAREGLLGLSSPKEQGGRKYRHQ